MALTLAPGANGSAVAGLPEATAVQPAGSERLNLTPAAGAPVLLVKVAVTFCDDPGVNVVTRDRLRRGTS